MACIGLVIRPEIEAAVALARKLLAFAVKSGHQVLCERESAGVLGEANGVTAHDLVRQADPVVILGGDGTFIGVARYIDERSPALIGVNFGKLGFLTEIAPEELFESLQQVIDGKGKISERNMILAEVWREDKRVFSSAALNEVVVTKGTRDKLLELDLYVNQEAVMRQRADGLIIATPTGSTAYSLAAGGSIVYPSLEAVLVTPMCAHSLTSRPLVLRLDQMISVSIPRYQGEVLLTVDGQVSFNLSSGDEVRVSKAAQPVRCVLSKSKNYFEILRTKLNWGIPNRST